MSKRSAVFSRARGGPSLAASIVAGLAGVALLLNGCALMSDAKAVEQETRTTAQGAVLELAGATINVPGTAVAKDTVVSASLGWPAAAPQDGGVLKTVSQRLQLSVGAPLADGAAMSVTLTLDPQEYAEGFSPSADSLALVHQRQDAAEPELIRVAWNPQTQEVNAQVPADGEFWAVHVDVPQVLKAVQSGVVKSAEMAASKPSCVGQQAAAAGMTFNAPSPAGAWICLRESSGKVVVSVSASTSVPLRLATAEQRFGTAVPNPMILNPYFQQVFTPLVTGAKGRAGALPGAAVDFELSAAGADQTEWTFQPYPALFLLNYLSTMVAATFESQQNLEDFDASSTAACVAPLVDTTVEHISLASSWAVPFVEGFMDCVAKTVQISPRMDVILGSLNAVPDLVASSAAALWEQGLLGEQARESVIVTIAGTMQWARYSGTLNAAKISFEHPAGWTVMDGSINQQFGQRNSVVVYDHSGNKKAELTVMDSVHTGIAGTVVPVTVLGTVAGGARPSVPAPFAVQSLVMDLGGKDQLRKNNLWPKNVKLAASIGAAAEPTQLAPDQLTGTLTVETGVKSAVHNKTTRQVSFSHVSNFDDMASAQNYADGSEFAAIQKMLASFTG